MAVIRKRRTTHIKSGRQQQIQQQQQLRAKQRFENSRLQPEQSTTMIHDESDTVSYRSYLLMNFVKSAEYIDILTTQPVPNDKIRPPRLFRESYTLEAMKERLRVQKEQLNSAKEALDNLSEQAGRDAQFLKEKLNSSENQEADYDALLKEYLEHFGLRSQNDKVVFYRGRFGDLRGDTREAPPDYWQKHAILVQERREKALLSKKQQEEAERERLRLIEEEKKKAEMEEAARQQEREKQIQREQLRQREQMTMAGADEEPFFQEPGQPSHSSFIQTRDPAHGLQFAAPAQAAQFGPVVPPVQQQVQSELPTKHEQEHGQQQQQQQSQQQPETQLQQPQPQQPQQEAMDSIFGDFGNEPFTNGFEDDFGDLDTAFF